MLQTYKLLRSYSNLLQSLSRLFQLQLIIVSDSSKIAPDIKILLNSWQLLGFSLNFKITILFLNVSNLLNNRLKFTWNSSEMASDPDNSYKFLRIIRNCFIFQNYFNLCQNASNSSNNASNSSKMADSFYKFLRMTTNCLQFQSCFNLFQKGLL